MAKGSLVLAANQGLLYVLSMVVIGGLVGAGALGYDIVLGFSRSEEWGKGVAAGITIVLLGIMLDRIAKARGRPRADAHAVTQPSTGGSGGDPRIGSDRQLPRTGDRMSPTTTTAGENDEDERQEARALVAAVAACAALVLAGVWQRRLHRRRDQEERGQLGRQGRLRRAQHGRQPLGRLRGGRLRRRQRRRDELGCKVNYKELKEEVSWQGFGTGEVDVVIEDWGHPDLEKKYIATSGGDGSADGLRPDRQRRASSAGTCRRGWPRSTPTSSTGRT